MNMITLVSLPESVLIVSWWNRFISPRHPILYSLFFSAPASLITEPLESLGDSITTAVLLSWSKEIGDSVKEDDVIAIVETDKVRDLLSVSYSVTQLFCNTLSQSLTYAVFLISRSLVVLSYLICHTPHQIKHCIITLPFTIAHSTVILQ